MNDLAIKSASEWIASTVRPGDTMQTPWGNAPGAPLIARAVQYVMIFAAMNAQFATQVPIRLMRPAKSTGKPKRKSIKERARSKWLQSASGVGKKAAQYAAYADECEEVTEHPVLDLLHRPNPFMRGDEWEELSYLNMEVSGNAYDWFYGDAMGVGEVYPLSPAYVRIKPSETDFIEAYFYARDPTSPSRFGFDEVGHQRFRTLADPFYGVGPLHSVLIEADLVSAATVAEQFRWANGGRPDWVFESAVPMDKDQREILKTELNRQTKGVNKTGRSLIVSQGKITVPGFAPKDMEYLSGMGRCDQIIANAYGIPEAVYMMNDANKASSDNAHRQYMLYTIGPRTVKRAEYLTDRVLPMFGVEEGEMWFAPDNPAGDDEAAETTRLLSVVDFGGMTLNEFRAEEGLDPYDPEIGDVPRYKGTELVSAAEKAEQDAAAQEADRAHQLALATVKTDQKPTPAAEAKSLIDGLMDKAVELVREVKNCGTGAGGFQEGNTCASGGGDDENGEFHDVVSRYVLQGTGSNQDDNANYIEAKKAGEAWMNGDTSSKDGKAWQAVYEETQSKLKASGVQSISAHRGVVLSSSSVLARDIASGKIGVGDFVSLDGDAFNSWTTNGGAASRFANTGVSSGSGKIGVVFERDIGATDVVASHRTQRGFRSDEGEVIAMSRGSVRARIVSVHTGSQDDDLVTVSGGKSAGLVYDISETRYQRGLSSGDGKSFDGFCSLKFYGPHHQHKDAGLTPPEYPGVAALRAEYQAELDAWFRKFIAGLIESGSDVVAGEIILSASDAATLTAKFEELAWRYLEQLSKIGVDAGAAALEGSFTVKPMHSINFLNGYIPKLRDAVTRDMAEGVRDVIRSGLEKGTPLADITDALKAQMPEIAAYKAERIARTESAHAYIRGQVDAWTQAGVETKQLIVNESACPICLAILAENPGPIPLAQPYIVDDWFGDGNPPFHPNCVCDISPVLADDPGSEA